ncbi:MAG: AAA family ATPase [Bacteroidales bacterium]|jgi:hypothetical protein|nr:AAA family ATPase [Bacteroidales bacterium]
MKEEPFVYGKTALFSNFTDREKEQKELAQNFTSLTNTIIVSPRRWGKSSLVETVAGKIMRENKKFKICLIDTFNVKSESEFYEQLAKGIIRATSNKWQEKLSTAKKFLSQLLPQVSFSPDNISEISFGVDWKELSKKPDDILNLAQNIAQEKKIKIVVCIDEFQSIGEFENTVAFQRKLRSHWQRHHDVCYCLYGSKRHMLLDIFSNVEMPFYRFGDIMFLEKISNKNWGKFIVKRFADTNKKITIEQAEYLANRVENHSYYVQQLAQQSWLRTKTSCNISIIDDALENIKNQLDLLFVGQIETFTAAQINFLGAVIDGETAFTSQENLSKYRMGTSANVLKIKQTLTSREIIDIRGNTVEILDPIFKLWLKENYFKR